MAKKIRKEVSTEMTAAEKAVMVDKRITKRRLSRNDAALIIHASNKLKHGTETFFINGELNPNFAVGKTAHHIPNDKFGLIIGTYYTTMDENSPVETKFKVQLFDKKGNLLNKEDDWNIETCNVYTKFF